MLCLSARFSKIGMLIREKLFSNACAMGEETQFIGKPHNVLDRFMTFSVK